MRRKLLTRMGAAVTAIGLGVGPAYGEEILILRGEKPRVSINTSSGTMVEFPRAVKVQGNSRRFQIEAVPTEVDSKTGKPLNIKILNIKSRNSGQVEEVPFVLAGNKTVVLKLQSNYQAPRHHRIVFPKSIRRSPFASSGKFLSNEIDMMRAMLGDKSEAGFTRQIVERNLNISGFPDGLEIKLVRRFEGRKLFGYVFKVTNTTDQTLDINPHGFRHGGEGRSALLQFDRRTLHSCSDSRNDKLKGCATALRTVVRSEKYRPLTDRSEFPFVLKGRKK